MPFACHASCRVITVTLLSLAAFAAAPAFAQSAAQWPDRPVRLLVPVGAGGAADTLARNLSNGFSQFANGQPLVVENRPGAGGTIAAAAVAREKPDGYTLFLTEVGPNAVSHTLTAKLPYDPHTAFTPIIHAANLPAVVLIRPTLPYATLADFVSAAKQQPGKFNTRPRAWVIGRICSWPISTAWQGSTKSTWFIARARKCSRRCCATKPIPRSSRSRRRWGRSRKARFARLLAPRCGRCRNCRRHRLRDRRYPASTSRFGTALPRRRAWIPRSPRASTASSIRFCRCRRCARR